MKNDTIETAIRAAGYIKKLEMATAHLESLADGRDRLNWGMVQPVIIELAASGNELVSKGHYDKSWLASTSTGFYTAVSRLIENERPRSTFNDSLREEITETLTLAIDQIGLPTPWYNFDLIGISRLLDQAITRDAITNRLPAEGLSLKDKHSEHEPGDVQNQRQFELLLYKLGFYNSVDCILEVLQSMQVVSKIDPERWQPEAIFECSMKIFSRPLHLTETGKQRLSDLLSSMHDSEFEEQEDPHRMENLVNMAKSGIKELAETLIAENFKHIDSSLSTFYPSLLPSIEKYTSLRLEPFINSLLKRYNDNILIEESLNCMLGYYLLTSEEKIDVSLLKFRNDSDYHNIARIVSNEIGYAYNPKEFTLNQDHLREVLAEFTAQRPGAIKKMAENYFIGNMVKTLPAYDVHRLETDLGL